MEEMRQGTFDDFLNDCKHGVYNFTDNGKCSCCGNCCTAILPVTKKEIKAIKTYVRKHGIKPVVHKADNVKFDFTCPFRNDELKICNVYKVRPKICIDFKCDKWQSEIDKTKEYYSYDNRYTTVNMRELFGGRK